MMFEKQYPSNPSKAAEMKLSRRQVRRKTHKIPALRFEEQRLTSFSGLLLFQALFTGLDLKARLRPCFESWGAIYERSRLVLLVHLLLGCRRLRDSRDYRDDPMVRRLLGLDRLPDVATMSRFLAEADAKSVEKIRAALPGVILEVGMDSAFFSDPIVRQLDEFGVEFTISVPFQRFAELKEKVEGRQRWHRMDAQIGYFEDRWKPRKWPGRLRFLVLRAQQRRHPKGPVQLDLFEPTLAGYDFTVVVANKTTAPRHVVRFHHGRGAQEGVFAELKSQGQLGYEPTRTLVGNQLYLLAALLAHNLNRELQMSVKPRERLTTPGRTALWRFSQLKTGRRTLVQRAGRPTRPQGKLTLTISANQPVRQELLHYLDQLQEAA